MTPINALCLIIGCAVGSAVVALITRKRIKPTRKREIKRLAKQAMEKIDSLTKNWPAGEYTITLEDSWNSLLDASFQIVAATPVDLVPQVLSYSVTTAKTVGTYAISQNKITISNWDNPEFKKVELSEFVVTKKNTHNSYLAKDEKVLVFLHHHLLMPLSNTKRFVLL